MTKEVVLLFLILPLMAVDGGTLHRTAKEERENLMQDVLGLQNLLTGGQGVNGQAEEATHMSTKSPTPPAKSPTPPTKTPAPPAKSSTPPKQSPRPPPPKSVTVTMTTPPTGGVVTMTSAPSHDDKYVKKIERLLFAIL